MSGPEKSNKKLIRKTVFKNEKNTLVCQEDHDSPDNDYSKWFYPVQDRSEIREGNNDITFLIKGEDAFKEMVNAIRTANNKEHYIYLLGWNLQHEFNLIARDPSTTVKNMFTKASADGVKVRAMLTYQPTNPMTKSPAKDNNGPVTFINSLPNGSAVLDNYGLELCVHHQKILVVKGINGLIGFCGGMDIDRNRIAPDPIHDVHFRVMGSAAADLANVFVERWNFHPEITSGNDPKKFALSCSAPDSLSSDIVVQIACTYGNGVKHPYDPPNPLNPIPDIPAMLGIHNKPPFHGYQFILNGEQNAQKLIHHAIAQAKGFIYIEDQYLVDIKTATILANHLDKIKKLIILITQTNTINGELLQAWKRRKEFIKILTDKDPTKIIVCAGKDAFIHSKIFIFDDKFAIIGSANCSKRGYTYDCEAVGGIFDTNLANKPLNTVHELRMKLWEKHLVRPFNTLFDPYANLIPWETPEPTSHIEIYDPDAEIDPVPNIIIPYLGNVALSDSAWDRLDPDGS